MIAASLPFIVTFLAWFGGGIVGVVTGFGCGLFAVPFMLICVEPEVVMPVSIVLCAVIMSLILVKFWPYIGWRDFLECSLVAAPGALLGVWLLAAMPVGLLNLAFGIFLVCAVLAELYCKHILASRKPFTSKCLELFLAFLAGVINGVCGMGGAALGFYASLAHWDKNMARGTFGLFFGINIFLCVGVLWLQGMLGPRELELCAWAIPGGILGTFAGVPLATRIPQETFLRLLLLVILISGCVLICKGL